MVGRVFLGRYEAVRLLGEGGMGRVYLAKQEDLGRTVVVKVMHDHIAADPKFCERFQRETLLMAKFQHPYVVTLYDASLNDPQGPCIVMEYIRGITLDTLLQRNQRLTAPRAGRLLGQLCEALQAAHSMGIVHRDLKPGNLMIVDHDTPYEKIKVMDFGLAKLLDARKLQMQKGSDTGHDFAVGTPGYISPEQVRGEEMDHRSDLYSVGVILFEMLSGRLPFTGEETMDVLLAHATETPPTFASLGANWVSPCVEDVVRRCMAKVPADRYASARDLAEAYENALMEDMQAAERPSTECLETNGSGDTSSPFRPLPIMDPSTVVHRMDAWMPDSIAAYKVRGFVNDVGGEVIESEPGMIRVRLGGKGCRYQAPQTALSWLGIGKKANLVDMEMRLERNPVQTSHLRITVLLTCPDAKAASTPAWRDRVSKIYCDLRGYLSGESVHD